MKNRISQTSFLVGLVVFLCSCGEDPTTNIFYEPVPSVHIYPTWINESTIAFESEGADSVGPGWLSVVPDNRGIVGYNISTGEFEMLIPDGVSPNANYLGNKVVGFVRNNSSPIVVWNSQEVIFLEEVDDWSRRSKVCVNHDGAYLAWRNVGSDHDIGIWIYSLTNQEYLFVGVPDSPSIVSSAPVWHPTENTLLYRQTKMDNLPDTKGNIDFVVELHLSSGRADTLASLDVGISAMSYSPDGSKIAVLGRETIEENGGIYILDATLGTYQKISDHRGWGLSWGEMGIVYNNDCGYLDNLGCGVLWLLNPTTGESHPITERFQFNFLGQE